MKLLRSEKTNVMIKEFKEFMKQEYGRAIPWATTAEVANFMGYKDTSCVRQYTVNCQKQGTKYFIPEIVENIIELGEWN